MLGVISHIYQLEPPVDGALWSPASSSEQRRAVLRNAIRRRSETRSWIFTRVSRTHRQKGLSWARTSERWIWRTSDSVGIRIQLMKNNLSLSEGGGGWSGFLMKVIFVSFLLSHNSCASLTKRGCVTRDRTPAQDEVGSSSRCESPPSVGAHL